ncbi:hypothetical protein M3Y99_01936200 [Aphelenchoides fujianensis]|nr:hypothetical protein M3Y99_01936200 [Aphelenchoides fujianensis]
MMNVVCHVKMPKETTQLVDRVQSRFDLALVSVQRAQRSSVDPPSHILFFDEPVDEQTEERVAPIRCLKSSPLCPQLCPSGSSTPSNQQVSSTFSATPPDLTPALLEVSVARVLHGNRKAELIVAKLERGESIEPAERQLLVRTAGRWLMDSKNKPTSLERAFLVREFFGQLPNFPYALTDFHNSNSRRLSRRLHLQLPRPEVPSRAKRRPAAASRSAATRSAAAPTAHEQPGPFPPTLVVPNEAVTQLSLLEENNEAFEARFADLMSQEHDKELGLAENIAENWENCLSLKIHAYMKRTNADYYYRVVGHSDLTDKNTTSTLALHFIPFLVRRLHRENKTNLSFLISQLESLDDERILRTMRENGRRRTALEKLLKAFYVYQLPFSQFRRAMVTLILTLFGLAKNKSSSCFREVAQCILKATD